MKFMSGRALFSYNPDLFKDGEDDDTEETKQDRIEEVDEDNDNDLEESKENEVAVD